MDTTKRTGPKNLPPEKRKEKVSVYFLPKTLEGLEILSKADGKTRSEIVEEIVSRAVNRRLLNAN